MLSAICLNLDRSKILSYGNGLILYHTTILFFYFSNSMLFADTAFNMAKSMDKRVGNIQEKEQNVGFHHYPLFQNCLLKPYSLLNS